MIPSPRRPRLARAVPALAVVVAVIVGVHAARRDGRAQAGATVWRSSTIATDPGDAALWVTSPDDDRVLLVDAADGAVLRQVAVPGRPRELTVVQDRVVATASDDRHLAVVPRHRGAVSSIALPCGSSRSVVAIDDRPGAAVVAVSCPADRRVALVDVIARRVLGSFAVPGRPTGLVATPSQLTVALDHGELVALPIAPLLRTPPAVGPWTTTRVWSDGRRASLLGPLDVTAEGDVLGAYQLVDTMRVPSAVELAGDGYGGGDGPRPRIEPALAGRCGARFTDLRRREARASGPVAIAAWPTASGLVWLVGQASRTVVVVRCADGPAARSEVLASFPVGHGARGIAVADGGRTAFVDVGFDHEVVRLDAPEDGGRAGRTEVGTPSWARSRPVRAGGLGARAEAGRRAFHDASDPHLTPFGVVACASCHPDGGDDGRTWRIETERIDAKVRRTPPLWGLPPGKPLHWDGSYDEADTLVSETITELHGGDGLGVDVGAITAYLRTLEPPPGLPAPVLDADRPGSVVRGRAVFEDPAVGCATCHPGPSGSDGRLHRVDRPTSPVGSLTAVATPTLVAVRERAAFGYDGGVGSLEELLGGGAGHGGGRGLDPDELADLLAYLATR